MVDLNTPIPAGTGTFNVVYFSALSGDNVAFVGDGSSGERGIYLFNGSALSRVVDLNTPIPGGSGTFVDFSRDAPALSGGNAAFWGIGSSGQQGIYLFNGSTLSRVADLNTPIPGGSGAFSSLSSPRLSGGNVAFLGHGSSDQLGIYLAIP